MTTRAAELVILAVAVATAGLASGCDQRIIFADDTHWPAPGDLPTVGSGKLLVTNNGDDTLSWIDLATLEVVYSQPVGLIPPEREGPHHGASAPDGHAYYVGLSNYIPGGGSGPHGSHGLGKVPGYVLAYDPDTLELTSTTRVDRNPGDVRVSPDGKTIVVTHFDLLKIMTVAASGGSIDDMIAPTAIIDTATMAVVKMVPTCPAAHGVAISADSKTAYVACWGSDEVAVVSLSAPYAVTKFHVGTAPIDPTSPTYGPYAITQSPGDGKLWVGDIVSNDLRIFDPATNTFDADGAIVLNGPPFFARFSSDGTLFYQTVQNANTLAIIDTTTHAVVGSLPFASAECLAPHAVLLLEDRHRALVVCEGDHVTAGTVAVVDITYPTAPTLVKTLTMGVYPDDIFVLTGAQ